MSTKMLVTDLLEGDVIKFAGNKMEIYDVIVTRSGSESVVIHMVVLEDRFTTVTAIVEPTLVATVLSRK